MPELPEVEVLVRYLHQVLPGRTIRRVTVCREKSVRPGSARALSKALEGRRFETVTRRAKFLVFGLSHGSSPVQLLGHLGMTGRMYLQSEKSDLPKHTAVWMQLDRGRFVFEDTRYFGRFTLDLGPLAKLGPEPLSEDFEPADFLARLKRSTQAIKVRLLNPELVVGIGNIYASEALYRAGIDPRTPSNKLSRSRAYRLHEKIRETLREAIELGSSLSLDWGGRSGEDSLFYYGGERGSGNAEERFGVYGREGEACRVCGEEIKRLVQAARSTFYCGKCQKRR